MLTEAGECPHKYTEDRFVKVDAVAERQPQRKMFFKPLQTLQLLVTRRTRRSLAPKPHEPPTA